MKRLSGYQIGYQNGYQNQPHHHHLNQAVYADGAFHIAGGKFPFILTDVWFNHLLAEVVVGAAETAVEDASQSRLGIAGIGTQMGAAVLSHEGQQAQLA